MDAGSNMIRLPQGFCFACKAALGPKQVNSFRNLFVLGGNVFFSLFLKCNMHFSASLKRVCCAPVFFWVQHCAVCWAELSFEVEFPLLWTSVPGPGLPSCPFVQHQTGHGLWAQPRLGPDSSLFASRANCPLQTLQSSLWWFCHKWEPVKLPVRAWPARGPGLWLIRHLYWVCPGGEVENPDSEALN